MDVKKKNPRSGMFNGTVTLTNGDWYRQLPAHMRRQLLRNIGETADDLHAVTWVMRVAGQRWNRSVS